VHIAPAAFAKDGFVRDLTMKSINVDGME
jgi:hypothetical protein